MSTVIFNKYEINHILGKGRFGSVCCATCLTTQTQYAVKLESIHGGVSTLKNEAAILHYLRSQKCSHIPIIYYFGKHQVHMCLVVSLYDEGSLEDLKESMTVEEKVTWWNSMLATLGKIHKSGIVHRDIKPLHFMRDSNKNWNLIDFGLATSYTVNSKHISETTKESIMGTPNFLSFFVHNGREPVRRDDIISLFYVFLYLLFGNFLEIYPAAPAVSRFEETDVAHPYNQWLQQQKEWRRLYSFVRHKTSDDSDFSLTDKLLYILARAKQLQFEEEPDYNDYFILSNHQFDPVYQNILHLETI